MTFCCYCCYCCVLKIGKRGSLLLSLKGVGVVSNLYFVIGSRKDGFKHGLNEVTMLYNLDCNVMTKEEVASLKDESLMGSTHVFQMDDAVTNCVHLLPHHATAIVT